ncbi:MAG: hypothetical protein EBT59_12490 [Betaproteobacteria bacterium]|nr:hypothetical protein [Betaproteobacteria bacterium]
MRNLAIFLTTLCLFWQSAVYAGVATQILNGLEQSHALMHFLGISHHHHQDESDELTAHKHDTTQENSDETLSVHQDASAQSQKHILVDFGIYLPAIVEDSLKFSTGKTTFYQIQPLGHQPNLDSSNALLGNLSK